MRAGKPAGDRPPVWRLEPVIERAGRALALLDRLHDAAQPFGAELLRQRRGFCVDTRVELPPERGPGGRE
jgi:hypothetical protein